MLMIHKAQIPLKMEKEDKKKTQDIEKLKQGSNKKNRDSACNSTK